MNRKASLLLLASLPLFCLAASGQSFVPKTIQFKGDTGYTDADLLAVAGLKQGASLSQADMNAHTKQLMDTGFFQDVSFTYNGKDLIYQIVPAAVLVPIELENLPLANDTRLDARLRARFPLYRGKMPVDGSFVDDIRKELEAVLHEQGMEAHLIAAPFTDQKLGKITVETFTVSSPDVSIGPIQLDGASAGLAPLAAKAAARITGESYSSQGSPNQIQTALNNFYGERSYLGATFHISQGDKPIVDAAGIHIPFTVAITEGSPYKLSAVTLAPDMIITQQAFDKVSGLHFGQNVSLLDLRTKWEYLTLLYRQHGHMHAEVHAVPTFDRGAGTVSYAVTAVPGPVFTMGALRVVNVPDQLHDQLVAAWKIPAGATFDEVAVRRLASTLAASSSVGAELRHALTIADIHSTLKLNEELHTVDVELTLVRKPL